MPWDWPVDVNCHEAQAFCQWKSEVTGKQIQLPSEAEWYCLRDRIETDQPWWQQAPGNINLEYWASSCPVNRFGSCEVNGESNNELYDVIGNVWQWTSTAIDGFDGFRVHPCYDDSSARFISAASELQASSRIRYFVPAEGELGDYCVADLRELGPGEMQGEIDVNRIRFTQGDACNLKDLYRDYDLIFAGNLIDRLHDPEQFLGTVHERLRPGGAVGVDLALHLAGGIYPQREVGWGYP